MVISVGPIGSRWHAWCRGRPKQRESWLKRKEEEFQGLFRSNWRRALEPIRTYSERQAARVRYADGRPVFPKGVQLSVLARPEPSDEDE